MAEGQHGERRYFQFAPTTKVIQSGFDVFRFRVGLYEELTATPLPAATMSAPQSNAPTYRTHLKKAYEVLSEAFIETSTNEYIVIGQLNFWYYGPGKWGGFEDDHGNMITPLTPLLGETYWAGDPSVVYQQIEWAVEYA